MSTFIESDISDSYSADQDEESLKFFLHENSRIGGIVKSGSIYGQFEYDAGVHVRKLFAVYSFGSGAIKVGQDYTPITLFLSGQVYGGDLVLRGVGNVLGERLSQVALKLGNFEISGIEVTNDSDRGAGETDIHIPKIEAAYKIEVDKISLKLISGYQTYEIDGSEKVDVTSWMLGAGGIYNFGAVYLKASASYYVNPEDAFWRFGLKRVGFSNGRAELDTANGDIDNFKGLMALLVAGMNASERCRFETGFGWAEGETEQGKTGGTARAAYLQSVIAVGGGIFLIPEVGYLKGETNSESETSLIYFGLKWQIDF